MSRSYLPLLTLCCLAFSTFAFAVTPVGETAEDVAAGHSRHGEVFNEGPRQQAYLMPGTGVIKFEVTTDVDNVQKFVEQGIGQLHGFWYFEAERSFRQAAMLDPECAIAYWGMAFANKNNKDRAKDFIDRAIELEADASPREQKYIKSLHTFLHSEKKNKKREAEYVTALEKIVDEHPDDLEAKAFLGYALYKYRGSADKTHAEVDVVLDSVLAKEKAHPVHHYRIHLWDHKSPQRALDSAAKCGPSADSIAHMWHMCGHIFSRVKRYDDAAWFQEASARVDHRHMMHDRVLPDQIHNFAHNNEWLIRNLINVGRISEALDLAKNMIELPRHPKYNMLDKRKSTSYGRDRLMDVLNKFEMWDEAIALADTPYLEPTDDHEEQLKRLKLLGEAFARSERTGDAEDVVEQLNEKLEEIKEQVPTEKDAQESLDEKAEKEKEKKKEEKDEGENETDEKEKGDKDEKKKPTPEEKLKKELKKKKDEHKRKVERIERDIAHVRGYLALAEGDLEEAIEQLEEADADKLSLALVRVQTDQKQKAVEDATDYAKSHKREVLSLAGLVEVCWAADDRAAAIDAFVRLRAVSNRIELQSPVFERLKPIAEELKYGQDWRVARPSANDLGKQPELDSLGPFRWEPAPAPDWLLPDAKGDLHSLSDYRNRPVVVVFYLGAACLHCAEQLQALAPKAKEFEEAGISVIAISSDELAKLQQSQADYDGEEIPFPLVANHSLDVFKTYRAFDDFEGQTLHGTYLIDANGRIRWQDISYDPFMDIDFLLKESKRLLAHDNPATDRAPTALAAGQSTSP